MFNPKILQKINSRNDVLLLVINIADFLKDNNVYDYLIDALWGNIQCQKKTLTKFQWENNKNFFENSEEWLNWTKETVDIASNCAAFSEELLHTLELWVNAANQSYKRKKVLYKTDKNIIKGVTLGPHFIVNNFINISNPSVEIDPNKQLDFIETLQHERIHVFNRYWNVLELDIPYAAALGIIAAQIIANQYDLRYSLWEKVIEDDYSWRKLIKGAFLEREHDFLISIENLQDKYRDQIENDDSYIDGYYLAIACSVYFNSVEKARIFIELLAYGVNIRESHNIAFKGHGKKKIKNRYEVFDQDTYRLKMAAFWNPGNNGLLGCCAWEALMRGGVLKYKNIFKDWGLDNSALHNLLGLRSADQAEASHFTGMGFKHSRFIYYSLPCATYSVKPFLSDSVINFLNEIQSVCSSVAVTGEFMDTLKRYGISQVNFQQELINPSINTPELQKLRTTLFTPPPKHQEIRLKIKKLTMLWTQNPSIFFRNNEIRKKK